MKYEAQNDVEKALAAHERRNAELCRVFTERNIDTSEPRLIECHFWAGSRVTAEELAKDLAARGFSILRMKLSHSQSEPSLWNVEAGIRQTIDLTIRREFTDDLVRLALAHASEYDGWGTRI